MGDDKNKKSQNAELDQILTEWNSSIQKDAASKPQEVQPEPEQTATGSALADEEPPRKVNNAPLRRKSGKKRSGTEKKPAGNFSDRATIIESESDLDEPETGDRAAVRHIAVTSVEVVEEPEQPAEPKPEPAPVTRRKRPRRTKREKLTAFVGLIVSVFCIIGVVCTVVGGVNLTYDLVNATAQKEELAKFIFPLVIIDTPEFEDPQALDNSAIISSAIWAFIIDDNDKSKYPADDFGGMLVPDVDIEPYIRRLYGSSVEILHQTVDTAGIQMYYDAETKSYFIESALRILPYTPRVDTISREKDIYTLKVSYVLPDALWELDPTHKNARVDKELEYRLQKTDTGYQILSVKLLALTGEVAPTSSSIVLDNELLELESSDLPDDTSLPDDGSAPDDAASDAASEDTASEPATSDEAAE